MTKFLSSNTTCGKIRDHTCWIQFYFKKPLVVTIYDIAARTTTHKSVDKSVNRNANAKV